MKLKLIAIAIALGAVSSAHAQFGLPKIGGGASSEKSAGGDVSVQIDGFNTDAVIINKTVSMALLQLKAAFDKKVDMAAIQKSAESITKATEAKEVAALASPIIKDEATKMKEQLSDAEAKKRIAELSPEMKKIVATALVNVGVASLKMPDMVDKGKGIIQNVSTNPMMAPKLLPVKDGVALFGDTLPKLPSLVSAGLNLLKEAKVDAATPTKDAKLTAATSITFPE